MTIRKTIRSTIRRPYYDLVHPGSLWNLNLELKITSNEYITDYLLPISLHKSNNKTGFQTGRDVYLSNACKNDFSNVVFEDVNGNILDCFILNQSNNDIQYNENLPIYLINIDDYNIIGHFSDMQIKKSTDGGENWTTIYGVNSSLCFVDSIGYIYIFDGANNLLKKSTDGGENWTTIYDMSSVGGEIHKQTISEDINGNIYIGRYQPSYSPKILKSSNRGDTWVDIFSPDTFTQRPRNTVVQLNTYVRPSTPNGHLYYCSVAGTTADTADITWPTSRGSTVTDGTVTWKESGLQHVHNLSIDPFTNIIYASFDGDGALFKSIDGGENWTMINKIDTRVISFGDGFRLFGAGTYQAAKGSTILRTEDDVVFESVLGNFHSVQDMIVDGDNVYAATVTNEGLAGYAAIIESNDKGKTWKTILYPTYIDNEIFAGYAYISNISQTKKILIGSRDSRFINFNLLINSSYSCLAFVKISNLMNGENILKIKNGTSNSNIQFLGNAKDNLLLRVKFNEGVGDPVDSSINNYTIDAIPGTGGWLGAEGRYVGQIYPKIYQYNKSYRFNGDGVVKITNFTNVPAKNITAVCWYKYDTKSSGFQTLFGNMVGSTGWALTINNGILYFYWGNGSSENNKNFFSGYNLADGQWHMAGIIIDNNTPAKIAFIHDGEIVNNATLAESFYTLPTDIVSNNYSFKIGSSGDSAMGYRFVGKMSDVMLFSGNLDKYQVRSLFEDRYIAASEPTVSV